MPGKIILIICILVIKMVEMSDTHDVSNEDYVEVIVLSL